MKSLFAFLVPGGGRRTVFGVIVLYIVLIATLPGLAESKAALLIIDVQDCFISGGSLAVKGANSIIPVINSIRSKNVDDLSLVVTSYDWHPTGHVSFASSHPGVPSPMDLEYTPRGDLCTDGNVSVAQFPGAISCKSIHDTTTLQQRLWPDHCLQNVVTGPTSSGLASGLNVTGSEVIIRKGTVLELDSYSAFSDNGNFHTTELDNILHKRDITHVFVVGLAADFCVYYTALDSQKLGYETFYVMDAVMPVSDDGFTAAKTDLDNKGVHLITSDMMPMIFKEMNQTNSVEGMTSPFLITTLALVVNVMWQWSQTLIIG